MNPPEDMAQIVPYLYYGNRQYTASDPGGHRWTFAVPEEAASK